MAETSQSGPGNANSSFSSLVQSLLPRDTLLRTYLKTKFGLLFEWPLKTGFTVVGSGPEVIKLFQCSTQQSSKFLLPLITKIKDISCFIILMMYYPAYKC